jgi:hypothetical protein
MRQRLISDGYFPYVARSAEMPRRPGIVLMLRRWIFHHILRVTDRSNYKLKNLMKKTKTAKPLTQQQRQKAAWSTQNNKFSEKLRKFDPCADQRRNVNENRGTDY